MDCCAQNIEHEGVTSGEEMRLATWISPVDAGTGPWPESLFGVGVRKTRNRSRGADLGSITRGEGRVEEAHYGLALARGVGLNKRPA